MAPGSLMAGSKSSLRHIVPPLLGEAISLPFRLLIFRYLHAGSLKTRARDATGKH